MSAQRKGARKHSLNQNEINHWADWMVITEQQKASAANMKKPKTHDSYYRSLPFRQQDKSGQTETRISRDPYSCGATQLVPYERDMTFEDLEDVVEPQQHTAYRKPGIRSLASQRQLPANREAKNDVGATKRQALQTMVMARQVLDLDADKASQRNLELFLRKQVNGHEAAMQKCDNRIVTVDNVPYSTKAEGSSRVEQANEFGEGTTCIWQNTSRVHELCATKGVEDVVKRLQQEQKENLQYKMLVRQNSNKSLPEVSQREEPLGVELMFPNRVGKLPLHIAAQTRRTFAERDGDMRAVEEAVQPGPNLVTLLLTGKNPGNGTKLFHVARDARGRVQACMHQDSTGMTPLHAACLSSCSTAYDIVCRLIEANPAAAGVHDMDGLMPLDLACRSPYRGASDIVKVLLRACPSAAYVCEETCPLEEDWIEAWEAVDPCGSQGTRNSLASDVRSRVMDETFVDKVLSQFPDGCNTLRPFSDLRYLSPQRIAIQYVLLDVDSCYHVGNISIPSHKIELTRKELREKLKSDMPSSRFASLFLTNRLRGGSMLSTFLQPEKSRSLASLSLSSLPTSDRGKHDRSFNESMDHNATSTDGASASTHRQGVRRSDDFTGFFAPMTRRMDAAKKTIAQVTRGSSSKLQSKAAPEQNQIQQLLSSTKLTASNKPSPPSSPAPVHKSVSSTQWRQAGQAILNIIEQGMDVQDHLTYMFSLFDADSSGALDTMELFRGMNKLGYPITWQEADCLLSEADEDHNGVLTLEEFSQIINKAVRLPAIFALSSLTSAWNESGEHIRAAGGGLNPLGTLYICTTTQMPVDARRVVMCIASAEMHDARQVLTRVPYSVGESFRTDEKKRREILFKSKRQQPDPSQYVNLKKLYERLAQPHDVIDEFRRLPLHFACANNTNPEAAGMLYVYLSVPLCVLCGYLCVRSVYMHVCIYVCMRSCDSNAALCFAY
jgi:ankyrin repeat protein